MLCREDHSLWVLCIFLFLSSFSASFSKNTNNSNRLESTRSNFTPSTGPTRMGASSSASQLPESKKPVRDDAYYNDFL